jgi:hypothetical protein
MAFKVQYRSRQLFFHHKESKCYKITSITDDPEGFDIMVYYINKGVNFLHKMSLFNERKRSDNRIKKFLQQNDGVDDYPIKNGIYAKKVGKYWMLFRK